MQNWLLSPPVAFIIILAASLLLARLFSKLASRRQGPMGDSEESYACGEEHYDHMAQPDYTTFFPFAFFFTLAHVATLIITTVPRENVEVFVMAAVYIIGASLGLFILFRR